MADRAESIERGYDLDGKREKTFFWKIILIDPNFFFRNKVTLLL
jgi:hypothetical protein